MQQNRTLQRHTRTTLKNANSEILDYQNKMTQLMQDGPLPEDVEAPHEESTTAAKKNEELREEVAIASGNDLRKASESMVGEVERIPLMVNNIDLEIIFIDYRDQCEDIFDLCNSDIMDMRPLHAS